MKKKVIYLIMPHMLLLFCLPGSIFGQGVTDTAILGEQISTLGNTTLSQGKDEEVAHYLKSYTFSKFVNLRFLAITSEFTSSNNELDHSLSYKQRTENPTVTFFFHNRSYLGNTRTNTFGNKFIVGSHLLANSTHGTTTIISRKVNMLRRFKASNTPSYLDSPFLHTGKFDGLKISMKWE